MVGNKGKGRPNANILNIFVEGAQGNSGQGQMFSSWKQWAGSEATGRGTQARRRIQRSKLSGI